MGLQIEILDAILLNKKIKKIMLLCMHTQKSDVGMKISFLCHNIFAHDIILYIEKQQTVEIKLIKKSTKKCSSNLHFKLPDAKVLYFLPTSSPFNAFFNGISIFSLNLFLSFCFGSVFSCLFAFCLFLVICLLFFKSINNT